MFVTDLGISVSIGIPFSAALVNRLYAIIVKSHQQRKIAMCTKGNEGLVEEDKSKGHFLLFVVPQKTGHFLYSRSCPVNDFIKEIPVLLFVGGFTLVPTLFRRNEVG